jgi:hypothetical protein
MPMVIWQSSSGPSVGHPSSIRTASFTSWRPALSTRCVAWRRLANLHNSAVQFGDANLVDHTGQVPGLDFHEASPANRSSWFVWVGRLIEMTGDT